MPSKKLIRFFTFLIMLWINSVNAADPSILEIRLMQSRFYETTATEFLSGLNEACKARGGMLSGFYVAKEHLPLTLQSLEIGNIICTRYDSNQLNDLGYAMTQFKIEGKVIEPKKIQVRILATSSVDDGPRGKKNIPVTDHKIYTYIFRDISDAIGVQDIPIKLNRAE
jgi:hypothetical protein